MDHFHTVAQSVDCLEADATMKEGRSHEEMRRRKRRKPARKERKAEENEGNEQHEEDAEEDTEEKTVPLTEWGGGCEGEGGDGRSGGETINEL